MSTDKYNSEGYPDPTAFEALALLTEKVCTTTGGYWSCEISITVRQICMVACAVASK